MDTEQALINELMIQMNFSALDHILRQRAYEKITNDLCLFDPCEFFYYLEQEYALFNKDN